MADEGDKQKPKDGELLPPSKNQHLSVPAKPDSPVFGPAIARSRAAIADSRANEAESEVRIARAKLEYNLLKEENGYVFDNVRQDQELRRQTREREIAEQKRKTDEERRLAQKQAQAASKQKLEQNEIARKNFEDARALRFKSQSDATLAEATTKRMAEIAGQIANRQLNKDDLLAYEAELEVLKRIEKLNSEIADHRTETAETTNQGAGDSAVAILKRHVGEDSGVLTDDEELFTSLVEAWEVEAIKDGVPPATAPDDILRVAKTKHKAGVLEDKPYYTVEKIIADIKGYIDESP